MKLDNIKQSPRPQQPSGDLPPGSKIGKVTKGPLPGVDQVERAPLKHVNSVINVAVYILDGNLVPRGNGPSMNNRLT